LRREKAAMPRYCASFEQMMLSACTPKSGIIEATVLYDSLFCDVIFAVAEVTKLTFLRTSHETEKIVR
jgi:hypothetical protein